MHVGQAGSRTLTQNIEPSSVGTTMSVIMTPASNWFSTMTVCDCFSNGGSPMKKAEFSPGNCRKQQKAERERGGRERGVGVSLGPYTMAATHTWRCYACGPQMM